MVSSYCFWWLGLNTNRPQKRSIYVYFWVHMCTYRHMQTHTIYTYAHTYTLYMHTHIHTKYIYTHIHTIHKPVNLYCPYIHYVLYTHICMDMDMDFTKLLSGSEWVYPTGLTWNATIFSAEGLWLKRFHRTFCTRVHFLLKAFVSLSQASSQDPSATWPFGGRVSAIYSYLFSTQMALSFLKP